MGKKAGNRRRQTLQLNDENKLLFESQNQEFLPEPESSNSVMQRNPLSGLLSQYMDSDDEEEENASQKDAGNSNQNTISNEVDDFLKEIDAITPAVGLAPAENINSITNVLVPPDSSVQILKPDLIVSASRDVNQNLSSCLWQECYDQTSGYVYYWHVHTNEVTWQCPEEYKLYKDTVGQLQQATVPQTAGPLSQQMANGVLPSNALCKQTDSSKDAIISKPAEGKIIPITSYGGDTSSDEDGDDVASSSVPVSVIDSTALSISVASPCPENDESSLVAEPSVLSRAFYGPALPSQETSLPVSRLDLNLVEIDNDKPQTSSPSSSTRDPDAIEVTQSITPKSPSKDMKTWVLSAHAEISRTSDMEAEELQEPDSTTARYGKKVLTKEQSKAHSSEESQIECGPVLPEQKPLENDVGQISNLEETSSATLMAHWTGKQAFNIHYNPDNTGNDHPFHPGFGFSDGRISPSHIKQKQQTGFQSSKSVPISFIRAAEPLDLNEVNRKNVLEYGSKLLASKKNETSLEDIEDIERELDMALERKTSTNSNSVKSISLTTASLNQACMPIHKRTIDPVATGLEKSRKRLKSADNLDIKPASNTALEPGKKAGAEAIENLLTTIFEKLDHFGVTMAALSQLQTILAEISIRMKDWKHGALSEDYFREQLKVTDDKLLSYESSVVPQGWTCHWDRSQKKYMYTNNASGQTRWTLPTDSASVTSEPTAGMTLRIGPGSPISSTATDIGAPSSSLAVSSTTHKISQDIGIPSASTVIDVPLPPLPPASPPSPPPPPPLPPPPPPPPPPSPPPPLPSSPPPPLPDSPPLLPPDSTEKGENDMDTALQLQNQFPAHAPILGASVYQGYAPGLMYASSGAPAFMNYPATMSYAYPTPIPSDAMQSEIDSFYSNLATSENGSVTLPSVPSVLSTQEQTFSHEAENAGRTTLAATPAVTSATHTKRKIKKTKIASGLVMKKKNIPTLVEKWQRIQQEQLSDGEGGPSTSN